jgi:hypothetical protein
MRRLRRSVIHRLLAGFVLGAMALWVGAPLAAAHPQVAAAQAARAQVASELEAAVSEALAVASQAADPGAAFAQALAESLEAHPDAEAILDLLSGDESLAGLLDLLLGKLLRASALNSPLFMAAAPSTAAIATVCAASVASADVTGGFERHPLALLPLVDDAPAPSIWELSAAQPLGP